MGCGNGPFPATSARSQRADRRRARSVGASGSSRCLDVTVRILTPAEIRLVAILKTQLIGGIMSGGSLSGYGPLALFAWHNPATITPDKIGVTRGLAQRIVGGRAQAAACGARPSSIQRSYVAR